MTTENSQKLEEEKVFTYEDAFGALSSITSLVEASLTLSALEPVDNDVVRGHQILTTPEATAAIAEIAKGTIAKVIDSTQIEYGPTILIPPSHCMHIANRKAANLTQIQTVVETRDFDEYVATDQYANKIVLLAANFQINDDLNVTVYKIMESSLQLKKKRTLNLILKNGKYDRLEASQLLLIKNEFDVVVIKGYAFFFTKTRFEQTFGFLGELRDSSGRTFDSVTTHLKIKGRDELRLACMSQPQMMAKMASISRSMAANPEYAAAMTMPNLLRFIKDHPNLGIETAGVGDDEEIVFNSSPVSRFKILNLLDDDYLSSKLTEIEYEANSKIRT